MKSGDARNKDMRCLRGSQKGRYGITRGNILGERRARTKRDERTKFFLS
jgi:hypothetical protein